ncbi:MAG TPA: hypothetical protein VNB64_04710 [Solirubrobacteraceae bacterium]|nr:hypothetical protein [Solirubrobacteraceae bacterium]
MRRGFIGVLLGLALALSLPGIASAGPVILGGDDLTEHGDVDASGNPREGWLYIQRALENLNPKVGRPNDNTVAALGSAPGPVEDDGNAGSGVGLAAQRAGLGITYHDGEAALKDFFVKLNAGQVRPKIIWLAGNGADNDYSESGGCSGTENSVITANAGLLDQFVSSGGGLMSHGSCYEWVSALLPGLKTDGTGDSDDLYLTPEGASAFPGVTNADVNAGPWHNFFEGNFGGLQPLVRSNQVDDSTGQDATVILGGGAVSIRPPPPPTCVNPTVVRDRKVALPGGGQAVLATRQFGDAATPFRVTVRITRQTARGVTYGLNGKVLALAQPTGRQISVPAAALRPARGRNTLVAALQLANGRLVVITQHFVIVRCSVPAVTCARTGAMTLRCSTRTPLGVRRVRISAASPAGGSAIGTATVVRGRYTATLRARVSLPPGRYTYRHVGTTARRGERMVMLRYVTVT